MSTTWRARHRWLLVFACFGTVYGRRALSSPSTPRPGEIAQTLRSRRKPVFPHPFRAAARRDIGPWGKRWETHAASEGVWGNWYPRALNREWPSSNERGVEGLDGALRP